jgi:hypothetical protein
VEELERIAARVGLVDAYLGQHGLVPRAGIDADLAAAGVDVPLHGVAEQVDDDEERVLGVEIVVDHDLAAVEIAGERIGHVADADRDLPAILDDALDAAEGLDEAFGGRPGHDWGTARWTLA